MEFFKVHISQRFTANKWIYASNEKEAIAIAKNAEIKCGNFAEDSFECIDKCLIDEFTGDYIDCDGKPNYAEKYYRFTSECDGYATSYQSVVICNVNWEDFFPFFSENLNDLTDGKWYPEKKVIRFNVFKTNYNDAAKYLSSLFPGAVVYVSDDWDYHEIAVYKNGIQCDEYTAKFEEEPDVTPAKEIKNDYDCNVIITDTATGEKICIGGGMCTFDQTMHYITLVKNHSGNESFK